MPTGTNASMVRADGMIAVEGDKNDNGNKKKSKPRQVSQTAIQPLTGDVLNSDLSQDVNNDSVDEDGMKKKKMKMKKSQSNFQCSICRLEFPSKHLMLEHRSKHTKLFKCKICSEAFYTEEKLNKHLEKESHNYPCDSCTKVLVSKASLQRHKVVHGEKNHLCDVCNRAFKTARDMKNHKVGKHLKVFYISAFPLLFFLNIILLVNLGASPSLE